MHNVPLNITFINVLNLLPVIITNKANQPHETPRTWMRSRLEQSFFENNFGTVSCAVE
jgi:hypothetical protein